jgi:hypothetical protein
LNEPEPLITGYGIVLPGINDVAALAQHDDWAGSFTVWGHVTHGMPVVERIVDAAYTQVLHPSGTAMRMLQQPLHIQVLLQQRPQ